jgi:hypothetical protein
MTQEQGYVWFLPGWYRENWYDIDHLRSIRYTSSDVQKLIVSLTFFMEKHLCLKTKYWKTR